MVELLVVIGVIGFLLAVLLPSVSSARQQARAAVCRSNLRELASANAYYRDDEGGVYCAGASDFLQNLHRWHGARDDVGAVFDSSRGPLAAYLGPEGQVRQCPSFPADEVAAESGGFERGNGGYGYNNRYVGVQLVSGGGDAMIVSTDRAGAIASRIKRPGSTIMFTDSAFAADGLIEYSFAEPRFHPQFPSFRAVPSIHFRHRRQANVVWCDGHADARAMTFTHDSGLYRTAPSTYDIGWFGAADDNRLFDLE